MIIVEIGLRVWELSLSSSIVVRMLVVYGLGCSCLNCFNLLIIPGNTVISLLVVVVDDLVAIFTMRRQVLMMMEIIFIIIA